MRRLLLALLASALVTAAAAAQEIVVFKDYRSLPVLSHREQGKWTYLRVTDGEIAVLTQSILEFRKEPAGAVAPPQAGSSASAQPSDRKGWAPEPAPPPREAPPEEAPPPEEPPPPADPPPAQDPPKKADD